MSEVAVKLVPLMVVDAATTMCDHDLTRVSYYLVAWTRAPMLVHTCLRCFIQHVSTAEGISRHRLQRAGVVEIRLYNEGESCRCKRLID